MRTVSGTPKLCSVKSLLRVLAAAEFIRDFAPLERALEYSSDAEYVVIPEQLIVELDLNPQIVAKVERNEGIELHWFASSFGALSRHSLVPKRKMPFGEWLGLYRKAANAHWRARRRFQRSHLAPSETFSVPQAAKFLRVSPERVQALLLERRLLGIPRLDSSGVQLPRWQFDIPARRVRYNVAAWMAQLHSRGVTDDWLVCAFFITRFPFLGGRAPVQEGGLPNPTGGLWRKLAKGRITKA